MQHKVLRGGCSWLPSHACHADPGCVAERSWDSPLPPPTQTWFWLLVSGFLLWVQEANEEYRTWEARKKKHRSKGIVWIDQQSLGPQTLRVSLHLLGPNDVRLLGQQKSSLSLAYPALYFCVICMAKNGFQSQVSSLKNSLTWCLLTQLCRAGRLGLVAKCMRSQAILSQAREEWPVRSEQTCQQPRQVSAQPLDWFRYHWEKPSKRSSHWSYSWPCWAKTFNYQMP